MHQAVRITNNIRLAFFPVAYALSGVLIGSTLNRVMIADLGYSTVFTAEVVMLVTALSLSTRMDYTASRAHQEEL